MNTTNCGEYRCRRYVLCRFHDYYYCFRLSSVCLSCLRRAVCSVRLSDYHCYGLLLPHVAFPTNYRLSEYLYCYLYFLLQPVAFPTIRLSCVVNDRLSESYCRCLLLPHVFHANRHLYGCCGRVRAHRLCRWCSVCSYDFYCYLTESEPHYGCGRLCGYREWQFSNDLCRGYEHRLSGRED